MAEIKDVNYSERLEEGNKIEIYGTQHKMNGTDFYQRCAGCGRLFYFSHDCIWKTVVCPYCRRRH